MTEALSLPSALKISKPPCSTGDPPPPCCDWYGKRAFQISWPFVPSGRGPFGAEVHEDAIALDDRRRRCPAVLRVDLARGTDREHHHVHQLAPAGLVVSEQTQRDVVLPRIVLGGRRQPHAAVGHDRRRPAQPRHGHLPRDVAGFAPLEGQTRGVGFTLPARPAKLRPLRRGEPGGQQQTTRRRRRLPGKARVIGWWPVPQRGVDTAVPASAGASAAHAFASPGAAGPLPKTSTIVAATVPMLTKVC